MQRAIPVFFFVFITYVAFAQQNSVSYAEGRDHNAYIGAGAFLPAGSAGESPYSFPFENGGGFEFGVHSFLSKYFGVGLTFAVSGSETKRKKNILEEGDKIFYDMMSTSFGLSLITRYPAQNYDLYAALGVEYFTNSLEMKYTDTVGFDTTFKTKSNNIGYRAEAGWRYYLTDHINAGFSAAYLFNSEEVNYIYNRNGNVDFGGAVLRINLGYAF